MGQENLLLPFQIGSKKPAVTPDYLNKVYWWAYVHPKAVKFFERQWLVNLILWGNFSRLRDCALDALGKTITGKTLQIACVYGDFTPKLASRMSDDAQLDVVDVLPVQLQNLNNKIPANPQVKLIQCNSATLDFAEDASYEQVVLFFLLHEQPEETRNATLKEACRVVKPGGKIILVDYHKPHAWHPLKYLMYPILSWLEPYALALWKDDIKSLLPLTNAKRDLRKQTLFGGLYQKIEIHC